MADATATDDRTGNEYRGDQACSLARAVGVVGQRWAFFILREAMVGSTRFSEFRQRLGIAPDILTARLEALVAAGLMQTRDYRESNQRTRSSYHLSDAGKQMVLTIAALQQWGDEWTPSPTPTSVAFRDRNGQDLRATFIDPDGNRVPLDEVAAVRVWEP